MSHLLATMTVGISERHAKTYTECSNGCYSSEEEQTTIKMTVPGDGWYNKRMQCCDALSLFISFHVSIRH